MTYVNIIHDIRDESLRSCVVNVVKEESSNICLLDLTLVNLNDYLIMSSLHKVCGLKFTSRTFLFDSHKIYNTAYVIESENFKELYDGLSQVIKDGQWNPKARYMIIFKNKKESDLLNVGNWFFKNNVDDVFPITLNSKNYVVFKLNIMSSDSCRRSSKWTLVSSCSQYLTEKSIPIVRKHEGIRNCQFKLITHNMWPSVYFDETNLEGTEQRILKEFEKYENVKIELYAVMKQTNIHGVIMPGYVDDMLKKVQDNEFVGSLGGHSQPCNVCDGTC